MKNLEGEEIFPPVPLDETKQQTQEYETAPASYAVSFSKPDPENPQDWPTLKRWRGSCLLQTCSWLCSPDLSLISIPQFSALLFSSRKLIDW